VFEGAGVDITAAGKPLASLKVQFGGRFETGNPPAGIGGLLQKDAGGAADIQDVAFTNVSLEDSQVHSRGALTTFDFGLVDAGVHAPVEIGHFVGARPAAAKSEAARRA
jgi:hypothetical protein